MRDINGCSALIAHIGHPTASFTAPLIYNPYFESIGLDVAVVPMGVRAEDFAAGFPAIMRMTNVIGALITMPHKVSVTACVDRLSPAARIAGACNAVRREADGSLTGDMFDGEGFVRGLRGNGRRAAGASALIVGAGGVGSAIAASLASAGLARLMLFDTRAETGLALARRLSVEFPDLIVETGANDPAGFDIVVNATPLGMKAGDPLPLDASRLWPGSFVGEVVLKPAETPLLAAARARECIVQAGLDMLYEMIPAYLAFFGLPHASAAKLRRVARVPAEGR